MQAISKGANQKMCLREPRQNITHSILYGNKSPFRNARGLVYNGQ